MQLSLPFLAMIKEGHPGALVLLAHYCVLLKKIEGAWYFEGRSRRLMGVVMGRLGREWWGFVEGVIGEVEG
jgi:hypothetical protein